MAIPQTKQEFIDAIGSTLSGNEPGAITAAVVRKLLTDFADKVWSSDRLHLPAEFFGCVAVEQPKVSGAVPAGIVDNLAAIQRAVDWSAETGGVVEFGRGVYGFAGIIRPKSHMSICGQGRYQTILYQMQRDTSGIANVVVDTNADGVSHCTIRELTIDLAWNKCAPGANAGIWQYPFASMLAVGLSLDGTQNGTANESLNWYKAQDTFHVVQGVQVKNAGGNCFYFGGRGEMMLRDLRAQTYANDGIVMASPDNWMSDCTVHVGGRNGVVCGVSNQRWNDIKAWFIGMSKQEEPDGLGFKFTGPSMGQSIFHGMTTQDTYGPGMELQGEAVILDGNIDEAAGGRLSQQGLGFQGTRTKPNACLAIQVLRDSQISINFHGSNRRSTFPKIAAILANDADNNDIRVTYRKLGAGLASPALWYDDAAPVSVSVGNTNGKRHNVVRTHDGMLLSGARTLAEIGDKAHSVNLRKAFGFKVTLADGREVTKTGVAPEATWVDAVGTVVATPA